MRAFLLSLLKLIVMVGVYMINDALIDFSTIGDERGVLVSLEQFKNIPFEIKRVYYIYRNQQNLARGFHAHSDLQQILICLSGSCKVILDNGMERCEYELDKPNQGIRIDKLIWREMHDFSEDCVLLVLASDLYNEADYIRSYDEFIEKVNSEKVLR